MDSSHYIEQVKEQYRLKSDYALAKKLGITQPEANLIRRGRKVPNAELCIRMANLLGKNPVELLLTAQKDKAASQANWNSEEGERRGERDESLTVAGQDVKNLRWRSKHQTRSTHLA